MKKEISDLRLRILETIRYFTFFDYPPTADEIHTFCRKPLPKRRFMSILEDMVKKSLLITFNFLPSIKSGLRYTLPEYRKRMKNYDVRFKNSLTKINKVLPLIKFISSLPSIKLVGISGSVAMLNADHEHDVDLFIITKENRMFTVRFFVLLLSQILGLRRKRNLQSSKDKVCFNLFFDESDLSVPDFKKSEYVAHEILQMKPLIVRGSIYHRFLTANKWVFEIFPNAQKMNHIRHKMYEKEKGMILQSLGDGIELLLRKLQLHFIKKHQTTEIITDHQLWFHPDDFEKKLHVRKV